MEYLTYRLTQHYKTIPWLSPAGKLVWRCQPFTLLFFSWALEGKGLVGLVSTSSAFTRLLACEFKYSGL
jgi:hypothetical protein